MKKVLVFGAFDLLHPGHIYFLHRARQYGDYLCVVLTRDEVIKISKGRAPLFNQHERMVMLKSLSLVDRVVLGDRLGKFPVCRVPLREKPDVIVFGHDQRVDPYGLKEKIRIEGRKIKLVQLKAYRRYRYASRIMKNYAKY